jgi:hypothetical protein
MSMKSVTTRSLAVLLGLLFSAGAAAQTVAGGNITANVNAAANLPITFTAGAAPQQSLQYNITFDPARLTLPLGPLAAGQFNPAPGTSFGSCNHSVAGTITCVFIDIIGGANLPSPIVVTIPFTAGTTVGSTTVNISVIGTPNVPPANVTNGVVNIQAGPQPAYSSTPAAGAPVLITDVVGGGATTATLTVTNSGATGAPALVLSSITGLSGVLSITPTTASINQGASQAFTISCAATSATDTVQTLSIVHNGGSGGSPSPATHAITCRGITGPTAPTAALGTVTNPVVGPINTTGTGNVVVNVLTAGNSVAAGDASLGLNCTLPAGSASFAITGGGTRTITAPAIVGANAPPIGFSCVRQATQQTATLTCAQTATPGPNPAALTATVTCPAGTTAPNPGVTPASGTAFNFVGGPSTALSGSITFTNSGGTAPWVVDSCTFSPSVAGYTVTGTYPLTIAAGGSQAISVGCTTPATPGTALANTTLTCAGANAQFTASYPVTCRAEQVVPVPTMSAAGKAMMALVVLLVGLVAVQLYRRSV